jgi:hypothetical protein
MLKKHNARIVAEVMSGESLRNARRLERARKWALLIPPALMVARPPLTSEKARR